MVTLPKSIRALLHIASFAAIFQTSSAQRLAFTEPDLSPIVSGATSLPYFTKGDWVTVRWTTPYEETTLLVYQQQKNKHFMYEVLAVNYPPSNTSYRWHAGPIGGKPLERPLYFLLENGRNPSCDGCISISPQFNVRDKSSQSLSTTSTSSSAAQTNPQATHTPVEAAQGGTNTPSSIISKQTGDGLSPSAKVGLGAGLGVGLAVVIILIVFACLFLRRRRQERRRISYRPTNSGNWTTDETEPRTQERPESGALGPWQDREARYSQSRLSQSGMSQHSNPFRPSYAPSTFSHRSWIDPFEWERPEMRDQDAMSQLRSSIHSRGESSGGYYTPRQTPFQEREAESYVPPQMSPQAPIKRREVPRSYGDPFVASRRSDLSYANTDLSSLEGMPEQLQPVHHRQGQSTGDGRDWPLP